ncbi:CNH domain-containing protein [Lyophyllum atratum]|nr:CNH domain-containing protein [Lyophyllum atratum]
MSSFAKLAKRIVLANRTKKQFESRRPLSLVSVRLGVQGLGTSEPISFVRAAFGGAKHILYGTNDGIYISGRAPDIPPMPVLVLPQPVSQIDVLEDHNLVIFLSGHRITTVPLSILSTATPRDSTSCTRVSSHATFFKIGVCSGRHLVCVVKAGLSTTCKLLQPLVSRPIATVPPNPRGFSLQPYKEFYVSEKVTSIHFLRTKLVAGTSRHDFEVIDVDSLVTQPLLDSSVIHPVNQFLPKCIAVFRIGPEVLLCYNGFCFKVNAQGVRIGGPMVNWRNYSIHTVALREPYLLGFGADHIEVRHIRTCALVQTIPITYTLLSISPELCMIQAQDGRLLGLQFTD